MGCHDVHTKVGGASCHALHPAGDMMDALATSDGLDCSRLLPEAISAQFNPNPLTQGLKPAVVEQPRPRHVVAKATGVGVLACRQRHRRARVAKR